MKKPFNIFAKLMSEEGATLVYVAILLAIFLSIAAFAIDIGYHAIVRNQLQNAADAAALAGCNKLYDRDVITFPAPNPRWAIASAEAATVITKNKADNKPLSTGLIATGWWDITQPSLGLRANTITPTANDGPAVRVTINKSAGQNAGPIVNFLGPILGVSTTDSGATATAVAASPGSVRPESILPIAIPKVVADASNLYNAPNKLLTIGDSYHNPDGGQWTSFKAGSQSAAYVTNLVNDGNPANLSIGDKIFIQSGTETSIYKAVVDNYTGSDIVFPVVNSIITGAESPIAGFVVFHIVCAYKGCNEMTPDGGKNEKIIMGYFKTVPNYGGGPIGPSYGPLDRCRLCQ